MKLTSETVAQVVDYYQKLVPKEYEVTSDIRWNIKDANKVDGYFEDINSNGSTIVNSYFIYFRKVDEILSLEMGIEKFNLPELEKVLHQI
ncbi:hypothetical protein NJT12_05365 [Flavobacterium sp. AC]|uniref:Uncharacterized protein n=1 Tax=Flavobacterium azizsancarii TaxID=2961580 RepID=A0ABT4W933_9FLAO|nr:hypothetical protein [Flavobacterium azizsancarii]MDA6069046.1 hypothetical protein [Flavobacterium azizsancarii]